MAEQEQPHKPVIHRLMLLFNILINDPDVELKKLEKFMQLCQSDKEFRRLFLGVQT